MSSEPVEPIESGCSSAEFYRAPPEPSWLPISRGEIKGEVSHLASDTLDAPLNLPVARPVSEERTHRNYRGVNRTDFPTMVAGTIFRRPGCTAVFPKEGRMAEARSASAYPRFHEWPVEDQRPLTLLRRLVIEIEDSIAQSRAVILSPRDAIELLERLEGRQFSN